MHSEQHTLSSVALGRRRRGGELTWPRQQSTSRVSLGFRVTGFRVEHEQGEFRVTGFRVEHEQGEFRVIWFRVEHEQGKFKV